MGFNENVNSEDFKCIECKCNFTVWYGEEYEEYLLECAEQCDKCQFYSKCTLDEKDYDIGGHGV